MTALELTNSSDKMIESTSFTLTLPDPALPTFIVQLTLLRDAIILYIGTTSSPHLLSYDFACAMTIPGQRPSSTALSRTATTSISLAAKLSKRYKRQFFLSLDLAALITQGRTADGVVLPLEKALLMKLDPILK